MWARREADGIATVGITAYGTALARDFVSFVPKPVGTIVERGRGLGIVELFKVVHSVKSPVSGRIAQVNERATADPMLIIRDPYGDGWLLRVDRVDWTAETALVTGDAVAEAFLRQMELDGFESPAGHGS